MSLRFLTSSHLLFNSFRLVAVPMLSQVFGGVVFVAASDFCSIYLRFDQSNLTSNVAQSSSAVSALCRDALGWLFQGWRAEGA